MPPRVRFAPSPTGYLHVGGARTALFNWLYSRHAGGAFVLRIEDTDQERSSAEMVSGILDGLTWLGLGWDEGPGVGGPYGPYFQAQRVDRHRAAADRLIASGDAYFCYCAPEDLEAERTKAQADGRAWSYGRTCRDLPPEEVARREREGCRRAVRFRVPDGRTVFDDAVRGRIEFDNASLEDFVILRSDGHPTYHLSVVVDDVEMAITDVIRGDDHISNTPKQILIYGALGAPIPAFAHVPLILGPDKKRLSKRHGATSVGEYRDQGYLPEAMVNFLALLGWSPGGDEEVFGRDELVARFSLGGISGGNAVFNPEKLDWFNQQHILRMPAREILERIRTELAAAGVGTRFTRCRGARADRARGRSRQTAGAASHRRRAAGPAVRRSGDRAGRGGRGEIPGLLGPAAALFGLAGADARGGAVRGAAARTRVARARRRARHQGRCADSCNARRRHRTGREPGRVRGARAHGARARDRETRRSRGAAEGTAVSTAARNLAPKERSVLALSAAGFARARRSLMRRDPKLAALITRVGPCRLPESRTRHPFAALVRAVVAQQLSGRAAQTIHERLLALVGGVEGLQPDALRALDPNALRVAGLSRQKISYLQDLAVHVLDGRLDLAALEDRSDEDVIAAITAVRGFGRWSAEMFLMFRLNRPDVFPLDDLGIVKGVQTLFAMKQRPARRTMERLAEAWRPYRSVAAWYLWRIHEPAPPKVRRNGALAASVLRT